MARRRGLTSAESLLADFYAGMDDEKLQCKVTRRHVAPLFTDPVRTRYKKRRDGVYQKVWTCMHCGTEVTELVAPSGYLDERGGAPRYEYPDGYLNPPETRGVGTGTSVAMARHEARVRNQAAQREAERAAKGGGEES